jgi:hypothetical protein
MNITALKHTRDILISTETTDGMKIATRDMDGVITTGIGTIKVAMTRIATIGDVMTGTVMIGIGMTRAGTTRVGTTRADTTRAATIEAPMIGIAIKIRFTEILIRIDQSVHQFIDSRTAIRVSRSISQTAMATVSVAVSTSALPHFSSWVALR